jgi:hypothetical protein
MNALPVIVNAHFVSNHFLHSFPFLPPVIPIAFCLALAILCHVMRCVAAFSSHASIHATFVRPFRVIQCSYSVGAYQSVNEYLYFVLSLSAI